jgi:hypothetical protein
MAAADSSGAAAAPGAPMIDLAPAMARPRSAAETRAPEARVLTPPAGIGMPSSAEWLVAGEPDDVALMLPAQSSAAGDLPDWSRLAYRATKEGFAPGVARPRTSTVSGASTSAGQQAGTVGLAAQTNTRCEQQSLSPGETVSGELGEPDCRWGQVTGTQIVSFVDQYRVSLAERGTLSIEASASYDLYLSVHDAGYGLLRDAASSDGEAAELEITLPAGDYVLLVTTLSNDLGVGGGYELGTTYQANTPSTACTPLPLAAGAGSARALDEAGCRVFDWLPGVLLDFPAQIYEVEIEESGTLGARITSSAFDPRHSLIDDEGRTLAADLNDENDPEPGASDMQIAVAAGSYKLLVLGAAGGTGDFALATTFAPAGGACQAQRIEATSATAASLSDDDCYDAWLDNGISVGTPLDVYEVMLRNDGRLNIDVDAQSWSPILWLLDGNDRVFLGRASTPPLGLDMPPGTYHLAIQSADDGRGDYTLNMDFSPVNPACQVRELGLNDSVDGDLAATACQLREYYFGASEDPVDPYVLRLEQRGELVVDLRSASFDTFLALLAGPTPDASLNISGAFTLSDDVDPLGGDTNSQVRLVLPAGEYLILATYIEDAVGPYQLTTAFTPYPAPSDCPILDLTPGTTLDASFDGFECTASDVAPARLVWSPVDRYRVRAPARGTLALQVSSNAFFPRLRLFDAQTGGLIYDDYDTTFNIPQASLGFFTTAREYIVHMESVSDTQFRGDYQIEAIFTAVPDDDGCREVPITAPGSANGALEANDCTWPEVPGGLGVPAAAAPPIDVYRVTLAQVGTLSATVRAGQFRPYVELLNQRRSLLEGEGPLSIGLPAELGVELIPGDYFLHVLSQDTAQGDYSLELDFAGAAFDPDALPTPTPAGPGPTATPSPTPRPVEPTPGPTAGPTPGPTDGRLFVPWTNK